MQQKIPKLLIPLYFTKMGKVVFSTPLSFEGGMKLVLENYFQDHKFNDLVLISKTD
jgi:hypothetical protein